MKTLRYYLTELCGITLYCDFRFIGSAAPLPEKMMWKWYDLVCDLINYARTDNKDVPLTVQLLQAPCLFSVSVYADNDSFGKYLDEYPTHILVKLGKLGIVSSDVNTHNSVGGSGIMIYAS